MPPENEIQTPQNEEHPNSIRGRLNLPPLENSGPSASGSQGLPQETQAPTNTERDSTAPRAPETVLFPTILSNYNIEHVCFGLNNEDIYDNQCAIRLGDALAKSGVTFESFNDHMCKYGHPGHVRGAQALAAWLNNGMRFKGQGKLRNITGSNWYEKINGQTGIIFFKQFLWSDGVFRGDHIGLWDSDDVYDISMGSADYDSAQEINFFKVE